MLFVNTLILCSSAKYISTHNVVISEMITFIFLSTVGNKDVQKWKINWGSNKTENVHVAFMYFIKNFKTLDAKMQNTYETIVRKH